MTEAAADAECADEEADEEGDDQPDGAGVGHLVVGAEGWC